MSIANQLQRIKNAKELLAQKAYEIGLSYENENGTLVEVSVDENGNTNAKIDDLAEAFNLVPVYEPEWIEENAMSLEVNETGMIEASVRLMGFGNGGTAHKTMQLDAKHSDDLTVDKAKVIVPAGFYPEGAEKNLPYSETINFTVNALLDASNNDGILQTVNVDAYVGKIDVRLGFELEDALAEI